MDRPSFKHLQLRNIVDPKTIDAISMLREMAYLKGLHIKQLVKMRIPFYRIYGRRYNFDEFELFVDGVRWSLLKLEMNRRKHIKRRRYI